MLYTFLNELTIYLKTSAVISPDFGLTDVDELDAKWQTFITMIMMCYQKACAVMHAYFLRIKWCMNGNGYH